MRTPPNPVGAKRLVPFIFALSALALAASARPARADGFLTFDRMDVEHCEELGTCEWKLSCKAGNGPARDLIPNGVGGDGNRIEIGQRMPVAAFPVTVTCSAWEDDGFLGTSWKDVATAAATLPAGGDYTIDLAGEGQGEVHVVLRADSLEIGAPPPTGDPLRFVGVFRQSGEGQAVVVGLDAAGFEARRAALAKAGIQPFVLQTYTDGTQRLWSAIFRASPEQHVVVYGLEWEPFRTRLEELERQGTHLIDFETYVEGKKRLFAGVFKPGRDNSTLVVGQSAVNFQNQFNKLTGRSLRLADFEVYRSGRDLLYSGVFTPGTGGSYGFRVGLDQAAFAARLQESGARLTDVETYQEGKKRLYDGSFKGSTGEVVVDNGVEWSALDLSWHQQVQKGLRLIDLETVAGIGSDE